MLKVDSDKAKSLGFEQSGIHTHSMVDRIGSKYNVRHSQRIHKSIYLKKMKPWPGEMAQWLHALANLVEDSAVSSTYPGGSKRPVNLLLGASFNTFSYLQWAPDIYITHKCMHPIKINKP